MGLMNKQEQGGHMSNVLVITTSLRARSNSDILAERLIAGRRAWDERAERCRQQQGCHKNRCRVSLQPVQHALISSAAWNRR